MSPANDSGGETRGCLIIAPKRTKYTRQRAQDQAQAAATIRQLEHQTQGFVSEAQGVIYELQGARQKERQERDMMKAEEEQAKKAKQKERTKLDEESKKESKRLRILKIQEQKTK